MNISGPVILVEDDEDDVLFFSEAYNSLSYPNPLVVFNSGEDAVAYLLTAEVLPFVIISDINMPRMNGFELRQELKKEEQLQLRTVPFILYSTASLKKYVEAAYKMCVQGFFIKPPTCAELSKIISKTMEYWKMCIAPNDFKTDN